MLSTDRILMAICTMLMSPKRISGAAICVAKSTLINFHQYLVRRKYSKLFSNRAKRKPGPKGPSLALIKFVVVTKENNLRYGSLKISQLVSDVLGCDVDESTVRRILKKHFKPKPGGGPSWLTPIGNSKDKLRSLDFFRLESVSLSTYWAMIEMDQYTRRIIGFSVHKGNLCGGTSCFMLNKILSGKGYLKLLSSDNDPLFEYWLWKTNLEAIYKIEELKSVPRTPWSHPFVERVIGTVRRDFTNHILFWGTTDLEDKLAIYQEYFNSYRVHQSLKGKTPSEIAGDQKLGRIRLNSYKWRNACGGLFHTPIAA
jgi:putative transposase